MTKLTDNLYLGGDTDIAAAIAAGCDALMNVALEINDTPVVGVVLEKVGLIDGRGNNCDDLESALNTLNSLIGKGYTVYLHCHLGVSRAPTIAMLYYHLYFGYTLANAKAYIENVHPSSSPNIYLWETVEYCYGEGAEPVCYGVECCTISPWQNPTE